MNRPNIIYIHSHDTGRYVQPYGHAVVTPNIQRLAEQGMTFRQAFCASPSCSASRAALLTGLCSHSSGMLGLAHRGFALADPRQHLAHFLAAEGYQTILCGLQHEAKDAGTLGYTRIVPVTSNKAADVAPAAEAVLSTPPGVPFFMSVGFFETHRMGGIGHGAFSDEATSLSGNYTLPPASLPDTPAIRKDMADFKHSASRYDAAVGRVLAALDRSGLAEHTLVICTTDHGLPFPGMKGNLTDHGTGVMLLLRHPRAFAGGMVCDQMVTHVDLFPTICALCGITPPPWLQGKSLVPLGESPQTSLHDEVFAEVNFHAACEPLRSVRTPRWKYIRRFSPLDHRVLANTDDGPSKVQMLEYGWANRPQVGEVLYDLALDPIEQCSRIDSDEAAAAILPQMRQRLNDWMKRTNDPLLKGPLALPNGALANRIDDASPYMKPSSD